MTCRHSFSVFALALSLVTGLSANAKSTKKLIAVGTVKVMAEIVDNEDDRRTGLMNRKSLDANGGMLFVFEETQELGFWMRNTLIPLSIGFFDENKTLVDIQDMEPASPIDLNPPVYRSKKPALYALEVNKGWFKKNKIAVGAKLKL